MAVLDSPNQIDRAEVLTFGPGLANGQMPDTLYWPWLSSRVHCATSRTRVTIQLFLSWWRCAIAASGPQDGSCLWTLVAPHLRVFADVRLPAHTNRATRRLVADAKMSRRLSKENETKSSLIEDRLSRLYAINSLHFRPGSASMKSGVVHSSRSI